MDPRVNDLTDKEFGSLIVMRRVERPRVASGSKPAYWECLCRCGRTVVVQGRNLTRKTNSTKTCGRKGCRRGPEKDKHGRLIEHDGQRHTIAGWARRLGISREALRTRLLRNAKEVALSVSFSDTTH